MNNKLELEFYNGTPAIKESIRCMQSNTPCIMHRYESVYICGCGQLISHSQGDWDEHRLHPIGISIPSEYYAHGDTAKDLFDRLSVYGELPYFDEGYRNVYNAIADTE